MLYFLSNVALFMLFIKATKEAKEGREGKKAITIEKKKEIVQKYESGVRVTNLDNMYSMSKSTLFYYKKVR
jgi:hypothetical protein